MSMEQLQISQGLACVLKDQTSWDQAFIQELVERPRDRSMGDWAFPCFQLAKAFRQSPAQIAQTLKGDLDCIIKKYDLIETVEAVGPYLNFRIKKAAIAAKIIPEILNGTFLADRPPSGRRIMIEYSQPNTHKAFHVGHMRNVALGDALARMLRWQGNDVVAANYIGDVGAHIAKCLWYFKTHYQGEVPSVNRGEFLGEMYRQAIILLDFNLLTQCPIPGIVSAEVQRIEPLDNAQNLKRVIVFTGKEHRQVVCGGTHFQVGDVVAFAPVGTRVKGRLVQKRDVNGVESNGMICSMKELGISEDNDRIFGFPDRTPLGQEVAELLRIPGSLGKNQSVLAVMAERSQGVSKILQDLEAKEPEITQLWEKTKEWSMQAFYEIYNWLDARFDHYFFESEVGDEGKEIVKDLYEKGVLIESEGTIGMDLSFKKLPFFMLLKSDGTGLYSTKDLALAKRKFEDFKIDHSVYVVDVSQSLHFQQVFATLEAMGFEQAKDCYHLAYGLVVLADGKMSSRGGSIILFSELRALLDQKIREDYLDKYEGSWPASEIEEASRKISIATIRYGMLNCDQVKNTVFDMAEWTSKSGNTGPYLLYAYARISSLLEKARSMIETTESDWSLLETEEEEQLLTQLAEFPATIVRAAEEHRPQLVCMYLFGLSKAFSRMYDRVPVLKTDNPVLMNTRLKLVEATGKVIKKALELIGIQTLERM